jgi:hypothetical protein
MPCRGGPCARPVGQRTPIGPPVLRGDWATTRVAPTRIGGRPAAARVAETLPEGAAPVSGFRRGGPRSAQDQPLAGPSATHRVVACHVGAGLVPPCWPTNAHWPSGAAWRLGNHKGCPTRIGGRPTAARVAETLPEGAAPVSGFRRVARDLPGATAGRAFGRSPGGCMPCRDGPCARPVGQRTPIGPPVLRGDWATTRVAPTRIGGRPTAARVAETLPEGVAPVIGLGRVARDLPGTNRW